MHSTSEANCYGYALQMRARATEEKVKECSPPVCHAFAAAHHIGQLAATFQARL